MIRTVFLDLDDTLLDFHAAEGIAIRATFDSLGIRYTDELIARYSEINRACWQRLERGELTRGEVLTERFRILYSELGYTASPEATQRKYEYLLSLSHPFINGAEELLASLSGKYDLYIASNGLASVQDRRIADSGIGRYFKDIFISERLGADKPSPRFFDLAFERIGQKDRTEAIIVGDSLTSDILGGMQAGIRTCHFNPKRIKNTTDIIPDHEIHELGELPLLLERI